jgi:Uma2 family endonuclease
MAQELKSEPAISQLVASPPTKMSYEEFLDSYDEVHAEWVDGKVIPMSPPSDQHQDLSGFLTALLRLFVEAKQLGVIRPAPFQMKMEGRRSGREPDILFVAREHLDRMKKNYLDGAADMVVEIVSPESFGRDRGDKFYEYEQGGVREYWLIDPIRKRAEFYHLEDDGLYRPATIGVDGTFRSRVLNGLELKVDWLWQEPLPLLMTVLKEWGLI